MNNLFASHPTASEWARVNQRLAAAGFGGVNFHMQEDHSHEEGKVLVDGRGMVSVLLDVVSECERRGRSVQDAFIESNSMMRDGMHSAEQQEEMKVKYDHMLRNRML